jgi:hypothetical protein
MRPRLTWVIVGAVVALLIAAGLDALRSKGSRTSLRTAPTAEPVSATPTEGLGTSPRIRQYVAGARAICVQALTDLHRAVSPIRPTRLEEIAAWYMAAAGAAESSLAKLQALPPPEADQALINDFFSAAEEEIDALRQAAAAAYAGERRRARVLSGKRVDASHRKDARADRLSERWRLGDLEILRRCPVALPA